MPRVRYTDGFQGCPLGPLPILIPFIEKMRIREIVDALVPCTNRAEISHGEVIAALILNRLLSPRAMYKVKEWSDFVAFGDALGINPAHLNDDRILRALEALYPQLEALQGTLAWQTIESFELDTSFLHWDMTSFFFEGSYNEENQDSNAPTIKRGCAKAQDAGKSRKQLQVGFATTSEEGIPIWHKTYKGNAAEISQVADVMDSLHRLVKPSSFTLIGDSKLLSIKNITKALACKLSFLAPEPRTKTIAETYLDLRETNRFSRLHVETKRKKDPIYLGFEAPATFEIEKKEQVFRRLFILSSEERRATRQSRKRQLKRFEEGIAKAQRNLGRYSYKTSDQVAVKVEALIAKTDLQDVITYRIDGEGRNMTLHIETDKQAMIRLRQLDGVYSLLTNLPNTYGVETLLVRYKRQYLSENRFAQLKGPLQLRPVFLKKNKRVVSLVAVTAIALMVYCLIEHAIRKSLRDTGTTLPDLYTHRPITAPTVGRLFEAFEFYSVGKYTQKGDVEYVAPVFTALQQQILDHLGISDPLSFLDTNTKEQN